MTHMAWSREWQASVRRTSALLTTALLALLSTAGMAVLAYRSATNLALLVAQGTAVAGALLQVGIVGRLSILVLRASRAWWRLRAGGKRTEQAKQLRRAIAQAIVVTALMSMSALAAVALAGSLPVFMQVPELGLSFLILITMLLVQRMQVRKSCHRLTDALAAAEHAARRTMVA